MKKFLDPFDLNLSMIFPILVCMKTDEIDEILGITRCARCGHRLEGEIECPFCTTFFNQPRRKAIPKKAFIAACFLTSPLSLYFVLKSRRLNLYEKIVTLSGFLFWIVLYFLWT
jgi:hypothetical protein